MTPQSRIEALRNAPPNGWAAFSEDEEKIVAYGKTYDEVVEIAQKAGVSDPVVVKIPENWNDRVLSA
jgi:Fe2+ transport system protein FeoA